VAYAVSVFFDEQTEARVRRIWARMAEAGVSSFLSDGPYRPHLTCAIYAELDVAKFAPALASLALSQKRFPMTLSYPGVFTGEEAAVFLAATVSQTLLTLHQRVGRLIHLHGEKPNPYYLPDCWNPHCSVARHIEAGAVSQAVAVCLDSPLPIHGFVESVGVIDTPAEVQLHTFAFQG